MAGRTQIAWKMRRYCEYISSNDSESQLTTLPPEAHSSFYSFCRQSDEGGRLRWDSESPWTPFDYFRRPRHNGTNRHGVRLDSHPISSCSRVWRLCVRKHQPLPLETRGAQPSWYFFRCNICWCQKLIMKTSWKALAPSKNNNKLGAVASRWLI